MSKVKQIKQVQREQWLDLTKEDITRRFRTRVKPNKKKKSKTRQKIKEHQIDKYA